jgi:hypothetical protein
VWIATAALTGGIVKAMELPAFRLYVPYFGSSIFVWGSTISVVMIALHIFAFAQSVLWPRLSHA